MEITIKPAHDLSIINTPSLEELINDFINAQDIKQNSKKLYRRTLKQYFNWIELKGYLLSEITRPQIIEYKENLFASGMSSLTIGSYITSVRRFYDWAEANKYYPNVAKGIKTPKRIQQFRKEALSPTQSKQFLEYYQDKIFRDYAIVNLLIRTGLRTIEAVRANIEDIKIKGGKRVLYVHGKGRDEKDSFVVLTVKAYQPVIIYLESRGKAKISEPLFTSTSNNSKGKRLTTRSVSKIAKEGLQAIGLYGKEFTAHSLRHTAIVNCRRAGGSLEQAQAMARHTSPVTTQIYDKIFREEERLKNPAEELIDNLY